MVDCLEKGLDLALARDERRPLEAVSEGHTADRQDSKAKAGDVRRTSHMDISLQIKKGKRFDRKLGL